MEFTDAEQAQLAATFGCAPAALTAEVARYTAAAQEEYLRMILGQRVFTRGEDIRAYRLLLMIRHVFNDRLPSEQQVSALFQTTVAQSRTLLRSVLAKYQYELQETIVATLKDLLAAARPDPNDNQARRLDIDNTNVVEALNRRISSLDGSLSLVVKVQGTGSEYVITKSSFDRVLKSLA
jgi:predicted transcriptional regulator